MGALVTPPTASPAWYMWGSQSVGMDGRSHWWANLHEGETVVLGAVRAVV